MSLGFHVSKSITQEGKKHTRKMSTALRESMELLRGYGIKSPCAQIFVSGPQNFKETLDADEKNAIKELIAEMNLSVVIHGSYVDNPWNRTQGSVHNIKKELCIAAYIGATGVIVHLGKGAYNDDNLKYVLEEVSNLPDDVRNVVTLWLEINTAKPSAQTYETPEKICRLFERVRTIDTKGLRIGLCIDTAHLFSCGMALDTYAAADNWLREVARGLPNDTPLMLHLNDSASALGSGVDRHAGIFVGQLWQHYHPVTGRLPVEDSGLVAILNWAEKNDIMVILERDGEGTLKDLTIIQQLGYFRD